MAPTPVLMGYADPLSGQAGDTVRFMVSCEAGSFRARLVRLIHGDENPAGPGYRDERVPCAADGTYVGQRQVIAAGSYVRVPAARSHMRVPGGGGLGQASEATVDSSGGAGGAPPDGSWLDLSGGLTVQAWVWPTLPAKPGGQALAAWWVGTERRGFVFGLDGDGRLSLELGDGAQTRRVIHPGAALDPWRWAFVAASFEPATGVVCLYRAAAEANSTLPAMSMHQERVGLARSAAPGSGPGAAWGNMSGDLLLAARELDELERPVGVFNGKIERPRVFGRALDAAEIDCLQRVDEPLPAGALGAWDFSLGIDGDLVQDVSGAGRHGRAVNLPTRAVTDHTWSGLEPRWTAAPEQYAAIHFHDDDLEDARWQPSFELVLPEGLRSGVYAMHLQAEHDTEREPTDQPEGMAPPPHVVQAEEYIPFYVRPPAGTSSAPIAFLAPTLTYQAYANERLYWNEGYREKRPLMTPLHTEPPDIDLYMAEHRELGLSLYDVHSDGSGCGYSSRLRPILNMRPTYRAWRLQNAPRHFAADLYLVGWLEARGFAYDVLTDEDLHREGSDLLGKYRVVLTGSHPEYYTSAMHTGVQQYLEGGGRLMYLGGNGFYWVTSIDPRRPHVIELRRGTTGTRAWESLPGEGYHSTSGEPGGLWRLRGQAPQRLVGVGFAAQGWGGAAGYRRLPASHDPRAAFIFDGIGDDEVIGNFGLVLDGAAGDEIDRFDARLGSPPQALVVATSAGQHTDYYQVTAEDVPVTIPGQGGTQSPKVRADMVFFETPRGGAVFAVGSINWLGSLGWNGYDNNVARVTENVLRRFGDPAPW